MWNCSEGKKHYVILTMISNGDASTYSAICDNVGYLDAKEECDNHFSKRLGMRPQ